MFFAAVDNCAWVSSRRRTKSCAKKSEVSIGESTFITQEIFVVNRQLPFGIAFLVPLITMGKIGTFSFMDSLNAPFWNVPIS